MRTVSLHPVDTWFFRDSTPFSTESSAQSEVGGLFPPSPSTVAGALRAALARARGWSGYGRWGRELEGVLGDGPTDLGALQLVGPMVLSQGRPVFPMPAHLLGRVPEDSWLPGAFLEPGPPVACDLGPAARLPRVGDLSADPASLEPAEESWITLDGLRRVLERKLPAPGHVLPCAQLWQVEPRVALARSLTTRTAEEGMLFAPRHVRLAREVSLGLSVTGVPQDWPWPEEGSLIPFGGESRLAELRTSDWALGLEPPAAGSGHPLLIALTPLDLPGAVLRGARPLEVPGGSLQVISACSRQPARIGGWSTLEGGGLAVKGYLPPASVLFCRGALPASGLISVGGQTAGGFGLVAVGFWNDAEDAA